MNDMKIHRRDDIDGFVDLRGEICPRCGYLLVANVVDNGHVLVCRDRCGFEVFIDRGKVR